MKISFAEHTTLFTIVFTVALFLFAGLAGLLKDGPSVGMFLSIGALIGSAIGLLYVGGANLITNHFEHALERQLGPAPPTLREEIQRIKAGATAVAETLTVEVRSAGYVQVLAIFLHPVGDKTQDEIDEATADAARTWERAQELIRHSK